MKWNLMQKSLITFSLLLIIGAIPFSFFGCSSKKYKVDYCGQEICYSNAKESYKAGSKVTLYFDLIATDTDYSFTLDGEPADWSYDEKKGFVIEFIMPEHDVILECHSKNSMLPYESE